MDPSRVDHVSRELARRISRRGIVMLLASLVGWPLAVASTRPSAAATCRGLNQACSTRRRGPGKRRRCCSGLRCRNKRCRPPDCASGVGSCGEGGQCCAGQCISVQTDSRNCGRCGNDCGGSPCVSGVCLNPCRAGLTYCDGECVDLLRDGRHCGTCGTVCQGLNTCQDGRCTCRQRLETCETDDQCCQNSRRAPLANPELYQGSVRCSEYRPGLIPGVVACDELPPTPYCCVGEGAICQTDCDCCGQTRCLGEAGCGLCLAPGLACPIQCPLDGPCDFCCTNDCVGGYCKPRQSDPNCQPYGQPCHSQFPTCCNNVPCSGGLCRYN
jgi:hypothetical protein